MVITWQFVFIIQYWRVLLIRFLNSFLKIVVHGIQPADVDGVEQLHRAAEHLLSQAGVNGEHGVVDMRVVALDVAQDGEEKLLHLVGGGLYAVLVALVGIGREVPVVAVARMEECGAVAQRGHGAHSHIGRAVDVEVEMGSLHFFAKPQHRQWQRLVDAPTAYRVVRREEVPVRPCGTPFGDKGVEMVGVEMGDDKINHPPVALLQQGGQASGGVPPVVVNNQAVLLLGRKAAVVYIVQLHGVKPWAQSQS